jgi:site-specific recombinase XerD
MLDQIFRRAAVRRRICGNPIGPVLQTYVEYLAVRGHRPSSLHQYTFAVEHFGRWLEHRPIDLAAVDRFIKRHLLRCRCDKPAVGNIACVRAALNRLLEMLGVDRRRPAGSELSNRVLRQYEDHLRQVHGLANITIHYRLRYARQLLRRLRVCRICQLRDWTSDQIVHYVATVGRQCKGRKQRSVPLWRESVRLVRRWLRQIDLAPDAPLLPNARGGRMTRSGIEHRLRVAVKLAAASDPSLRRMRISPHTIRHTTAMHLLQSGVDLSVIAMWLGHESIQTTHQYLDADLESKKRALDHLKVPAIKCPKVRVPQQLVQFLKSL